MLSMQTTRVWSPRPLGPQAPLGATLVTLVHHLQHNPGRPDNPQHHGAQAALTEAVSDWLRLERGPWPPQYHVEDAKQICHFISISVVSELLISYYTIKNVPISLDH